MQARSLSARAVCALTILVLAAGCRSTTPAPSSAEAPPATASTPAAAAPAATPEPEHIKLQHILISFAGMVPGKNVTRTREEAASLAAELLERARKGEDFDALVKTYTDDQHPGVYGLANRGVTPGPGEYPRDQMVAAFGDVGFTLQPGQTGMAPYDSVKSKYGWHVIRRLE